ncbi:MAG: hypothetical protein FWF63_10005, partial [Fibromonadales bacterium]|nr:hypothetical protein [Fibromonadales bacterium]
FFILAVAFLLSCTSIERDSVCDEKSIKYNGCVGVFSSSSSEPDLIIISSSSSESIIYGNPVILDGETYKTVVIGTQTWMAKNLKYAAPGSKCGTDRYDSKLKDENTEICNVYGRLYNWATAMDLPASCNTNSTYCSKKITGKHKGICPYNWHIPSNEDWNVLMKFINSRCSDNSRCDGAGTKLKATIGWNSYNNDVPSGSDDFGFYALPGGSSGYSDSTFFGVGSNGEWWSSFEYGSVDFGSDYASSRSMSNYDEAVSYSSRMKSYLASVRCVKD